MLVLLFLPLQAAAYPKPKPSFILTPLMRILLIEDEADLIASLARALREEGYAVDTATDGKVGLYKAESAD